MSIPYTAGFSLGTQPPLGRITGALRLARVGFDVAWVVDHWQGFVPYGLWNRRFTWAASGSPHAFFDFQVLLGALARKAGKTRIAVGVTEPVRRHPVLIAQAFLTLAHLADQAPILGIGAGERENIEPYGLPFRRPVSRLEEALDIIRRCFTTQGPFDYDGEFYRLRGAIMDLEAPPGRTPHIWVAAHGPRMLRLAGRYGDGWYPTVPMSVTDYEASLSTIRQVAADAGRNPAAIVAGYQLPVVFGRTDRDARKALESRPMRFMALMAPAALWRAHGEEHPLGPDFRGYVDFVPEAVPAAELEAMMDRVAIDLVAKAMLWGNPRTVLRRLMDYYDAGLRHLNLAPVSALRSRRDAALSIAATTWVHRAMRRHDRGRGPVKR